MSAFGGKAGHLSLKCYICMTQNGELDTDRGDARSSSFRVTLRAEPSYFAAAAHPIVNVGFVR